jgi:hypothetical protein
LADAMCYRVWISQLYLDILMVDLRRIALFLQEALGKLLKGLKSSDLVDFHITSCVVKNRIKYLLRTQILKLKLNPLNLLPVKILI